MRMRSSHCTQLPSPTCRPICWSIYSVSWTSSRIASPSRWFASSGEACHLQHLQHKMVLAKVLEGLHGPTALLWLICNALCAGINCCQSHWGYGIIWTSTSQPKYRKRRRLFLATSPRQAGRYAQPSALLCSTYAVRADCGCQSGRFAEAEMV